MVGRLLSLTEVHLVGAPQVSNLESDNHYSVSSQCPCPTRTEEYSIAMCYKSRGLLPLIFHLPGSWDSPVKFASWYSGSFFLILILRQIPFILGFCSYLDIWSNFVSRLLGILGPTLEAAASPITFPQLWQLVPELSKSGCA